VFKKEATQERVGTTRLRRVREAGR